MQHEVSMIVCTGRTVNQRKVPKCLPFKKLQLRITKYFMCTHGAHMYICVLNMKFLCLTLAGEEVCTDDNANANTDDDVGRRRTTDNA